MLLVAWPTSLVFKAALAPGIGPCFESLTEPEIAHALVLTAIITVISVLINLVFGLTISILLCATTSGQARDLGAARRTALGLARRGRLALVLVYNGRDGWFGPTLENAGFQVIFADPGHGDGHGLRRAAADDPRGRARPRGDRRGPGAGRPELGAGAFATLRRITLPGIKWAVVYGVVLSLARSLGEFGAVKIVSGNIAGLSQTATLAVEDTYQTSSRTPPTPGRRARVRRHGVPGRGVPPPPQG